MKRKKYMYHKNIFFCAILLLSFCSMQRLYGQQGVRSQVQYLSGRSADETKTWDFWVTAGRNAGVWSSIEVPAHWEQQGFGAYNYGRDNVTFGKNFRYHNEQGFYKHQFDIPEDWKDKDIYIVFEGAMTDTEVKINGQLAGPIHQGAFYRFKYLINDKVRWNESNLLEVNVSKMSSDRSVNGAERYADYWIFGGIYRPVYLEAFPKENIEWTAIDAKADGAFAMNVYLRNVKQGRDVHAEIIDASGRVVGEVTQKVAAADTMLHLKTKIDQPKLWSAEFPNLYKAKISVRDGQKKLFETADKFGFRTIEIRKGDGIYINAMKVKMKGVNRHVFWPDYGRASYPEGDLVDVKAMKAMNMNAVRCSHYPPDKNFLRVCDSLGLYVLNELAGWQTAYSTDAGAPLLKEMVQRDVNHPSIILWSNGNEGGHNKALVEHYAKYDLSNRPVIHAHHRPGNAINGIDGNHYEDYYSTKRILEDSLIYMPTEFLHALHDGGGAAALADFWELHWHAKRGAGGFIWNLADEAIVRTDQQGRLDANGYNGPDGVLGPYRQKEGSAYAIKEIYSPVKMKMNELPADFDGRIPVENRYHFTNLRQCTFEYELANFQTHQSEKTGSTVLKKETVPSVDIAPLGEGVLKIDLPLEWRDYDVLALRAVDPHGEEIYRWTWKIKSNRELVQPFLAYPSKAAASFEENDHFVVLKGGDVTIEIDKKSGLLATAKNEDRSNISLKNGPILVSGEAEMKTMKSFMVGDTAVVEVDYSGNMDRVVWKMHPNGVVELHYRYQLEGKYPFAGVTFDYPENLVLGAKWLGKGPVRVWKNRTQGVTWDVYENFYNPTAVGRDTWAYPAFKGYFSDVVWMELQTMQGKFLVASPDKGMYTRLFDFYAIYGAHAHPLLPKGDLSFLDAIPATGTNIKTGMSRDVKNYGPSSEQNVIDQPIARTLYFYFGSFAYPDNRSHQLPL